MFVLYLIIVAIFQHVAQSSLLKYWEFEPSEGEKENDSPSNVRRSRRSQASDTSDRTPANAGRSFSSKIKSRFRSALKGKEKGKARECDSTRNSQIQTGENPRMEKPDEKAIKKMPVGISLALCVVGVC